MHCQPSTFPPDAANPEEIDLDLGDAEDEAEGEGGQSGPDGADDGGTDAALEVKAVPAEVFGSLAEAHQQQQEQLVQEQLGALERFKKRRVDQG